MKSLILISAVCLQMGWSYGYPGGSNGVGAYAYQDSSGNRYGGTYGLKDGQVFGNQGDQVPFGPNQFQDFDDFFPEYFRNLENLLQDITSSGRRRFNSPFPPLKPLGMLKKRRAFRNQLEHQRAALDAAKKAYDLTSNQAGYISDLASRFPFGGQRGFRGFAPSGFEMPGFDNFPKFGPNSAFAGAAAGPEYSHQVAAINPNNPGMPNVDVTNFSDMQDAGRPGFYQVQSSSYSSSSNVNGKETNHRGAETVVNNNGKVTKYKVNN